MSFHKHLPIILACLTLVSCASRRPTSTQFLGNNHELRQDGKDLRFKNPRFKASEYQEVYISEVLLQPSKNKLSDEQKVEIKQHYQDALAKAFATKFTVVPSPGPKTLTVRSSITALDSVNVAANAVLSVVAVPIDNGGASTETEILLGNERQYAESRSVVGGFVGGEGTLKSKAFGYLNKTGHIKSSLTSIAEELVSKVSSS